MNVQTMNPSIIRRSSIQAAALVAIFVLFVPTAAEAQDSPHGTLSIACEDCHTSSSWKDISGAMKFDHSRTKFALTGQHAQVACLTCHKDLKFSAAPLLCADCHTDVHRNELGNTCDRCHTPASWLVPDMARRHNGTRFPLVGAHQSLPCQSCHINQQKQEYVNIPVDCAGCHLSTFNATTSPAHRAAGFSTDCQQCHSVTSMTWGGSFSHETTGFPLIGAHQSVQCISCHAGNKFAGTPTNCVDCHLSSFNAAVAPKHVAGVFTTNCTSCHSMTGWKPATFDHSKTVFPLTGAHASRQCVDCHANNQFASTPTQCFSCHQSTYASTTAPMHSPGISKDCTGCHTTVAWQPSTFNHGSTGFVLTGTHATVLCANCHANGVYANTATACVGCHLTNFTTATNPVHSAPAFTQDCASCHTTTAWKPASFDHSKTQFPLTGAHVSVQCGTCHVNGVYTNMATACVGCHLANFTAATNPVHTAPAFSQDCASCHTTMAWQPASFDHSKTQFPLTGAHVAQQCVACHVNNQFIGIPVQCYSCHQSAYVTAAAPVHSPGLPTDCTGCHNTTAWQPSVFNHSTTGFVLVGAHTTATCAGCHPGGVYSSAATTCSGCHIADFNATTAPAHAAAGFPTDCTLCHTPTAWQPSSFDHSKSGFPLTGAHLAVKCMDCHFGNQFASRPTTCIGCHWEDAARVMNPKHVSAVFSTDCTKCHSTAAWNPATFDHNQTAFPLTGAHLARQCTDCHKNNQFAGTPVQCYACHSSDYSNPATVPVHTIGLSTDCTGCHTTTAWVPSSFTHTTVGFALTGAHTTVACNSCHKTNYAGASTACYGCHQADYNATTNPIHSAAGFPTTCQTCHTTTTWAGATFNHTWFPITHGNSGGVCANCHTSQTDFTQYQCTVCHPKADMDPHHTGVPNYVYSSPACYSCHPTGRSG